MRDNDFNPETILEKFLNSFSELVNLYAPLRSYTVDLSMFFDICQYFADLQICYYI